MRSVDFSISGNVSGQCPMIHVLSSSVKQLS